MKICSQLNFKHNIFFNNSKIQLPPNYQPIKSLIIKFEFKCQTPIIYKKRCFLPMLSKPISSPIPLKNSTLLKKGSLTSPKKNKPNLNLNILFTKIPLDIMRKWTCREVQPYYLKKTHQEKIFTWTRTVISPCMSLQTKESNQIQDWF